MNDFYSEQERRRPPLSRQKEFRSIKNAVIREAELIRFGAVTFEDEDLRQEDEQSDDSGASTNYRYLKHVIYDESRSLNERDKAVEELRGMAEHGDPHAQYLMGKLYRDGPLLIPDTKQALYWFARAAEQNIPAEAICMGIGIFAGITLCGPAAQAATAAITAEPSSQPIYVDGALVEMEAYGVHGNNFVKLRDIGQAVGFNVYWDGSAVQIESDRPYTGEPPASQVNPSEQQPSAPAGEYTISVDHWSREDFSQQANPAVFTGIYDRALYNTIRQTIVDGEVGDSPAYTMVGPWEDYSAVKHVLGRMEGVLRYEHYVPLNFPNYWQYLNYFAVSVAMPENFQAPYNFIQPVIRATAGMTDREKVTYLNDYLGTLLTYKKGKTSGVTNTLSPHTGELESACSSYARAFSFLCAAADIPCITISTDDHTWNLVYVDGRWLHVDTAANDLYRNHNLLLTETYPNHPDRAPEQTAFLKELLVPGSTK